MMDVTESSNFVFIYKAEIYMQIEKQIQWLGIVRNPDPSS